MHIVIRFTAALVANAAGLWASDIVVAGFNIGPEFPAWAVSIAVLAVVNTIFWPLFKLALSPVIILTLAAGILLLTEVVSPLVIGVMVAFVFIAFFARIVFVNLGIGLLAINALALSLLGQIMPEITLAGLIDLFYASLILSVINAIALVFAKRA